MKDVEIANFIFLKAILQDLLISAQCTFYPTNFLSTIELWE